MELLQTCMRMVEDIVYSREGEDRKLRRCEDGNIHRVRRFEIDKL